jgi:branched-chain amino acid transport system substrate-binding protein
LVTPLSGPLGGFGRDGAEALTLWAEEAAGLPARYAGVELSVYDAQPVPADAMRSAMAASPQLTFGPYGSGTAVAAVGATSRLVWNHGGATSALSWDRHRNVVNVLSPASSYLVGSLELVRATDRAARGVVIVHGDTGFGRDVAIGAADAAARLDFAAHMACLPAADVETGVADLPYADVLLVAGRFTEEVAAGRALLDRPWSAAAFVGAGEEEVLAALGDAREGLLGPAQWVPQPSAAPGEGPDTAWFARRFARRTGRRPSYPAAQAFAAGVLAARALREAGDADDAALRAAAAALSCTTLYGAFRLNPRTGLQVGHRVVTVQWQRGRRRVVWPEPHATFAYPLHQR